MRATYALSADISSVDIRLTPILQISDALVKLKVPSAGFLHDLSVFTHTNKVRAGRVILIVDQDTLRQAE